MFVLHARKARSLTAYRADGAIRDGGTAPRRRARRLIAVPALLVAGLGLAACGPSSNDHPAAAGGASGGMKAAGEPASGTSPGCTAVPATRVKSALGVDVSAPTAVKAGNAVTCEYAAGGNPMRVIVRFETGSTVAAMQAMRKYGDTKGGTTSRDLPGVGDAAYTVSLSSRYGPTVNTVAAQKGSLNVQVTAPAPLPAVKALVVQLIS